MSKTPLTTDERLQGQELLRLLRLLVRDMEDPAEEAVPMPGHVLTAIITLLERTLPDPPGNPDKRVFGPAEQREKAVLRALRRKVRALVEQEGVAPIDAPWEVAEDQANLERFFKATGRRIKGDTLHRLLTRSPKARRQPRRRKPKDAKPR